jgi:hypothetical protein
MAKRRVGVEYSPSMLEPVRPGGLSPDRALCLPTFSHFVIVNKTSLSFARSLALSLALSLSRARSRSLARSLALALARARALSLLLWTERATWTPSRAQVREAKASS